MTPARSKWLGAALLLGGIGFVATSLTILLQPEVYKSVATVQACAPPNKPGTYPDFILTEFEFIQSHAVLGNVIQTLNLNESWGKKYDRGRRLTDAEAERLLKRQIELGRISNTSFVKIGVFDDDPNEAATLANGIARRYHDIRTEEVRLAADALESKGLIEDPMIIFMDDAIPEMRPVRPRPPLPELMMLVGMFLMFRGIIRLKPQEWTRWKAALRARFISPPAPQ